MCHVLRTLQATLAEREKPLEEWITVVPAVQWALSMASRPSIGTMPFKVMMDLEPRTGFAPVVEKAEEGWLVEPLMLAQVKRETARIVDVQEERHRNVLCHREAGRVKLRECANRGELPYFLVGDFVLVCAKPGSTLSYE